MKQNREAVHICPRCEAFFKTSFLKYREARPGAVPKRAVCDVCGRTALCVEYVREVGHAD